MTDEQTDLSPRGLMPAEIRALRKATGGDAGSFGDIFGVSPNIVSRWEELGVPSGPSALALRLVAREVAFDFPEPEANGQACTICGGPATESVHELAVCASCYRDPVANMEALGYRLSRTEHASGSETLHVGLPQGRALPLAGRFMGEGLGTMLTKMFKEEPQIGHDEWDDAVYVHWIEPGVEALSDADARTVLRSLVAYGVVDVTHDGIDIQHIPNFGPFDEEIILLSGLLANRLQA